MNVRTNIATHRAGSRQRDANYLARPRVLGSFMLVDAFGREVTDIRVSVTKRCNFGCIYCHDEGLGPILKPRMPHEDEMSVEQIGRLLRVAREFGIRSVKFTGGNRSFGWTWRRSSIVPSARFPTSR